MLQLKLIFMNMVIYRMDVIGENYVNAFKQQRICLSFCFLVVVISMSQNHLGLRMFLDNQPVFLVK